MKPNITQDIFQTLTKHAKKHICAVHVDTSTSSLRAFWLGYCKPLSVISKLSVTRFGSETFINYRQRYLFVYRRAKIYQRETRSQEEECSVEDNFRPTVLSRSVAKTFDVADLNVELTCISITGYVFSKVFPKEKTVFFDDVDTFVADFWEWAFLDRSMCWTITDQKPLRLVDPFWHVRYSGCSAPCNSGVYTKRVAFNIITFDVV